MDIKDLVLSFGWPGAILVLVGLAAWRLMNYLGHRFFDDDKGIVTKIVATHLETMDKLNANSAANTETMKMQTAILIDLHNESREKIVDIHKVLDGQQSIKNEILHSQKEVENTLLGEHQKTRIELTADHERMQKELLDKLDHKPPKDKT
jgi:hypothetical protein